MLTNTVKVWCSIAGDPTRKPLGVRMPLSDDVDDLVKTIYEERKTVNFRDLHHSSLELWKLNEVVPCSPDDTALERIKALGDLPQIATKLERAEKIANVFPEPIKDGHFSVGLQLPAPAPPAPSRHPAEMAHKRALQHAMKAAAPSSVSTNMNEYRTAQDNHPIYNGRPGTRKGPPIAIYHPVFAQLREMLGDTTKVTDEHEVLRVQNTAKLINASMPIYLSEDVRGDAIYGILEHLLGVKQFAKKEKVMNSDGKKAAEADFMFQPPIGDPKSGLKAPVVCGELKNEYGLNGQCGVRNDYTLRRFFAADQYEKVRNATCCPCITISVAGPYISFGGAVFAETFIAEAFTGFIYLGGPSFNHEWTITLSRIFAAVAQAIESLRLFYKNLQLDDAPDVHRLLPNPSYYDRRSPQSTLVFDRRFQYEGRNSQEYRRSLFCAKYDGKDVLVKFCEAYHGEAHRKVASAGFAPELFFCEKIKGGGTMVIMEWVDTPDAHCYFDGVPLPENVLGDVKAGLEILHDAGFVFGDLRRPNILIKKLENGSVKGLLVDFDWTGLDNQARYPPFLDDSGAIPWATGVRPHEIMEKKHDLEMFMKL